MDGSAPLGAAKLLRRAISRTADPAGLAWLADKRRLIADGAPDRILFAAFSAAPRYLGKADLAFAEAELTEAGAARHGWDPRTWTSDQAGRALLLLSLQPSEAEFYVRTLNRLFDAADVGELVALYQTLPLLPFPERHRARAAEGVRSNMTSVFEAVALRNPYPAEWLDDAAWNQMVLKAVFLERPLHAIQGVDSRANATLARMLADYAHERWAAHRTVTPELWRPVGRFAQGDAVADLERVLNDPDVAQQEAAALALSQNPAPRARQLLADRPSLHQRILDGRLNWDSLSRERLGSS